MKCYTFPFLETYSTKFLANSYESYSSTPNLHLTVHGTPWTLSLIALIQEYTSLGYFIRHAPNEPD